MFHGTNVEDRRVQLGTRVPYRIVEALKRRARSEGETEATVVRRILRDALSGELAIENR
ncbi:MAG: hypothetical protein LC753_11090 [Acidobacteria bacterium]|nr:hypothetical protein [Acidobacteriota bacterium]MCA1650789.1 hypothetical protein [Acidobacteriota bacterium]